MCIDRKEIVCWLMKTAHMHKNFVENKLCSSKIGIFPAQHRILMQLAVNPGINQKELARKLNVSPATVAISIKKLIKEGYISRENQKEDNRNNLLTITDSGRDVLEKSIKVFEKIDKQMFMGFNDNELEQLKNYLSRISVNLN